MRKMRWRQGYCLSIPIRKCLPAQKQAAIALRQAGDRKTDKKLQLYGEEQVTLKLLYEEKKPGK